MSLRLSAVLLGFVLLYWHPIARGDEAAEKLVLASYKLAGEGSTATGVVYRRETREGKTERFLVTAGHVLEGMTGDSCNLVSRSLRDDGLYHREEIRIAIRQNGEPLWKKHAEQDLVVIRLAESVAVESLPLDSLATEELMRQVHVGDSVRLGVFPERSEANPAGLPILRGGVLASHPLVPVKPHAAFLVDTSTWTGDSGGAVIHEALRSPSGGPLVIGIVRGMRSVVDAAKESRFVERRTQYPLGISEVLQAALVHDLIAENWPEKEGEKK